MNSGLLRSAGVAALTAVLTASISACTSGPPERPSVPAPPSSPEISAEEQRARRETALGSISHWSVKGKVAYRLPDDAGSASLHWQQMGDQTQLRLSGPLGVGSTRIRNEGALLRVSRDGIDRLYPADGAPWLPGGALLPIPVDSIKFWLRGLADPVAPIERIEQEAVAPLFLQQAGWKVYFEDYEDQDGLAMPRRLLLEAPAAELTLKLVLRSWKLGPESQGNAEEL